MLVAVCALVGCGESDRAVDPDGHDHETLTQSAPLPSVAMDEVIGAVGAVSTRDAARTLDRWLRTSEPGRRLLTEWPRREDDSLDLERAPVRVASIEASIGPGSKSKCGDVTVVFAGDARVALRMKLAIPSSAKSCRGTLRASRIEGAEAAPLLQAAIADARVPDTVDQPSVAQN